tara:strand:+ start:1734 stop:2828 length:1095 start_codon:yes stop_codon:yes gene_type:complete
MIKDFINQIKNLYKFYKIPDEEKDIVFFSEGKTYFNVFESYIKKLEKYKKLIYITSDKSDPIFKSNLKNIEIIYCKNIYLLIILMNNISCKNLIMTMPDLNNHEIKKSKNVGNYIYLFHSLVSTHMVYKNNAFDAYDIILCATQNQYDELKHNKELKNLNYKLYKSNYPKLNILQTQASNLKKKMITIAPSWGEDNIFEIKNFDILLDELIKIGFKVILRPHSNVTEKTFILLYKLKKKYSVGSIIIETDNANFNNPFESSYLITDWSGIALEYFMITKNPIIFVDTKKKVRNERFNEKIDKVPLEVLIRSKIGIIISTSEFNNINYFIKELENKDYIKEFEEINKNLLFSKEINEDNFNQILD